MRVLASIALAAAALAPCARAAITVDGSDADWPSSLRVSPAYFESTASNPAETYMALDGDSYAFYVKPIAGSTLLNAHIYLNTDMNRATGYSGAATYQMPAGSDAYIYVNMTFDAPPQPNFVKLYTGCSNGDAGCSTFHADLPFALVASSQGMEFKLTRAALNAALPAARRPASSGDLEVATLVANSGWVFQERPRFFLDYYTFYANTATLPACSGTGGRSGAVVFSDDVQARFFQDKAYAQLFMSMQYQFMQAGVPYDRITIEDLENVAKVCKYKVIVIPYLAWVDPARVAPLKKALFQLMHAKYGVSVVTIGDFMTNSAADGNALPGDPYYHMTALFGLSFDDPVFAQTTETLIRVADNSDSFFADKQVGQLLMDKTIAGLFTNMYIPATESAFSSKVLATQTLTRAVTGEVTTHASIIASSLDGNIFGVDSGRAVHFSTMEVAANLDLVWRAIEWALLRDGPSFGLQMSRQPLMFVSRNDMDQSQFYEEAIILEENLLTDFIEPWYEKYGYVCSYYLNIGNNRRDGRWTDWRWARQLYGRYMLLENEIGSHSYNHPDNINLPGTNLRYEFDWAQRILRSRFRLRNIGTAGPGATEELPTAYALSKYFKKSYFSGGYSGINAGYPGTYGYIDANSTMVYMAPNLYFDFTAVGFLGWTPERTKQYWLEQIANQTGNAKMPILHWPWHDYGPTDWDGENLKFGLGLYNRDMFEGVLDRVSSMKAEFMTGMDFHDRIRVFSDATVSTTRLAANRYQVAVPLTWAGSLGVMSLSFVQDGSQSISSVKDWYAYSATRVFLPIGGGSFEVTVGNAPTNNGPTRISDIGMRMHLLYASGDGQQLSFSVYGRGDVVVTVPNNIGGDMVVLGGDTAVRSGNKITISFKSFRTHVCVVGRTSQVPGGRRPST